MPLLVWGYSISACPRQALRLASPKRPLRGSLVLGGAYELPTTEPDTPLRPCRRCSEYYRSVHKADSRRLGRHTGHQERPWYNGSLSTVRCPAFVDPGSNTVCPSM